MKYFGDENKRRVALIYSSLDDYCDKRNTIGFIYDSGNIESFITELDKDYQDKDIEIIDREWMKEIYLIDGVTYYFGRGEGPIKTVIYMELSQVGNGGSFTLRTKAGKSIWEPYAWKENSKTKSLEMKISQGNFEFICNHRDSGNGTIDVKYTKRNNLHRNVVTLEQIELINPNNHDYIMAIGKWKRTLALELNNKVA